MIVNATLSEISHVAVQDKPDPRLSNGSQPWFWTPRGTCGLKVFWRKAGLKVVLPEVLADARRVSDPNANPSPVDALMNERRAFMVWKLGRWWWRFPDDSRSVLIGEITRMRGGL